MPRKREMYNSRLRDVLATVNNNLQRAAAAAAALSCCASVNGGRRRARGGRDSSVDDDHRPTDRPTVCRPESLDRMIVWRLMPPAVTGHLPPRTSVPPPENHRGQLPLGLETKRTRCCLCECLCMSICLCVWAAVSAV